MSLSQRFRDQRERRLAAEGTSGVSGAANDLMKYCEATFTHRPPFHSPPHMREVAKALEAVERGELTRLLVVMPPRHGKSMLISESFPTWYLGRNPKDHVIHAGYAQGFIDEFGLTLREKADSPAHKAVFPNPDCWLSAVKRSIGDWRTNAHGGYLAVGAGTGVTGRTGHLIILDDPIKGHEEADSELQRAKLWKWFKTDLSTRLTGKNPKMVIVMTRWHEDDIIGRLEKTPGWKDWKVIHHEAIHPETGEALAPDLVPKARLMEYKETMTPREWQALYVGRPTPEEGSFFRAGWIHHAASPAADALRAAPETMAVYGASDYAVSEKKTSDYTVHMVFGIDKDARLWVLDLWRGKTDPKEWADELIRMMRKWKPRVWFEEGGLILKSVGPFITERMRAMHVYCRRDQLPSIQDKTARATAIAGRMQLYGLAFDDKKPWAQPLLHEVLSFPHTAHDDQVDCLSLIGRAMNILGAGALPEKARKRLTIKERLRRSWAQKHRDWDREDRAAGRDPGPAWQSEAPPPC